MNLTVNGRALELPGRTPLLDYLAQLGVNPRAVAVELNSRILDRSEYASAVLSEGDVVEIVRMVGGGKPAAAIRWRRRISAAGRP